MTIVYNPPPTLSLADQPAYIPPFELKPNVIINVGPTRVFTSIYAAIQSILKTIPAGNILIQVDDGVYNEPSMYLAEPNLSGRLSIVGNLLNPSNCRINCLPNPALSAQIGPYITLNDDSSRQQYALETDYTNISHGFITDQGFILRLGGFWIKGTTPAYVSSFDINTGQNRTHACLYALNGSSIICANYSMILDGAYSPAILNHCATIQGVGTIFNNIANIGIWCFYNSRAIFPNSTLNGPGMTGSGAVLTNPNFGPSLGYNGQYFETLGISPFYCNDSSCIVLTYSLIQNFPLGGQILYNSSGFFTYSTFKNISNNIPIYNDYGCVNARRGATANMENATFNNVYLPYAGGLAVIDANYSSATNCPRGFYAAAHGQIYAVLTQSKMSNVPSPYMGLASSTKTPDGSVINYS